MGLRPCAGRFFLDHDFFMLLGFEEADCLLPNEPSRLSDAFFLACLKLDLFLADDGFPDFSELPGFPCVGLAPNFRGFFAS